MSIAAGEAKDAASKAVADGKKAVNTTKGKWADKILLCKHSWSQCVTIAIGKATGSCVKQTK